MHFFQRSDPNLRSTHVMDDIIGVISNSTCHGSPSGSFDGSMYGVPQPGHCRVTIANPHRSEDNTDLISISSRIRLDFWTCGRKRTESRPWSRFSFFSPLSFSTLFPSLPPFLFFFSIYIYSFEITLQF